MSRMDTATEEGNGKPLLLFLPRIIMVTRKKNSKSNDVKDPFEHYRWVLSGRDCYVQQVTPNHHQMTVCNNNIKKIGTWNVRTLFQKGKLDNVIQEMQRLQINLLGLCEVRWTGAGKVVTNNTTLVYSGGGKHEYGVGVLVGKEFSSCLLAYWAISERVMLVKIKGRPFNIAVI